MTEYAETVNRWISMVSSLINPMFPAEPAGALRQLRPHLAEFPAWAFTPDSARGVAEAKRFGAVPGWDAIAPVLRQHERANRPSASANRDAHIRRLSGRVDAADLPEVLQRTPEEIARVEAMLADMRREQAAVAVALCDGPSRLRDVSLQGGVLLALRERAGMPT